MYDAKNDRILDTDSLLEQKGLTPAQTADVLALVGDAADNIPGVPGIGPKKATALIQKYGQIDNLLAHKARTAVTLTTAPSLVAALKDSNVQLGTMAEPLRSQAIDEDRVSPSISLLKAKVPSVERSVPASRAARLKFRAATRSISRNDPAAPIE